LTVKPVDLRELRERRKLSMREVAIALDVTETTVGNWEHGRTIPRIRLDQHVKWCQLYGVTSEQLLAAYHETIRHERVKQVLDNMPIEELERLAGLPAQRSEIPE
jgi:transcriptional regulator with XRE-family HTH domain